MYFQQHHCGNLKFCIWGRNSYICCVLFTGFRTRRSRVLECLAVAECSIPHFIKSVNVIMSSNGETHRHHYELITILLLFLNTNALQQCLICTPQSVLESKISPLNQRFKRTFVISLLIWSVDKAKYSSVV